MGQFGLFDADKRLAALSAKGDPLEAIDRLVPWESFRADIEAVGLTAEELRNRSAGRRLRNGTARRVRSPGSLRSCSFPPTRTSAPKATWRVAGRWLTPRSCRSPRNASVV